MKSTHLILRLSMLAVLACGLLFVKLDRGGAMALTECNTCDSTLSSCLANCFTQQSQCEANYSAAYCADQREHCDNVCFAPYGSCLTSCSYDPTGGGGGPTGCGRGRTPCEMQCRTGRQQCVAEGGQNCGQEYMACLDACCS